MYFISNGDVLMSLNLLRHMMNVPKKLIHTSGMSGLSSLPQLTQLNIVKAGVSRLEKNKQGNTCQTDKWLCFLELSVDAICFRDKAGCSPKQQKEGWGSQKSTMNVKSCVICMLPSSGE